MDITPFVGPAFRLLRERIEISQEELAFRAGLDRTYVSGIERGRRNPSLKSMQRVAAELDVSLDQVFAIARKLADNESKHPKPKTKLTRTPNKARTIKPRN